MILCGHLSCLTIAGCGFFSQNIKPVDYNQTDLTYNRSGCGKAPFPFWFHLTAFETRALQDSSKIKSNDPEALFALAIIASGDVRDSTTYKKYWERYLHFVEKIRPEMEAEKDFWQKGYKIYQAMRLEFFPSDSANDLKGYDWWQSRLSGIFETGAYNCISSSVLYCVLAQQFGLHPQGVLLPSHSFVQLKDFSGKKIEVETTSKLGYDWIHDEAYYKSKSAFWFQERNLTSSTYADFQCRKILEPWQLICADMTVQHTDPRRMHVEDIHRLKEAQAFIEDTNANYQNERLTIYLVEFASLLKHEDYKTAERFFKTIFPILEKVKKDFPKNSDIKDKVARLFNNKASMYTITKNYNDFIAATTEALSSLQPGIIDSGAIYGNCLNNAFTLIKYFTDKGDFVKAESLSMFILPYSHYEAWLVQNIQWAYGMEMNYYWNKANWERVIRVCKTQKTIDRNGAFMTTNNNNLEAAYCNWSGEYLNKGNWPKAREILKRCECDSIATQTECAKVLTDLEKAHRF
jgi:hypothetical protein